MQIFVVGSKPDPHWPSVKPDVVILANGAIAYAKNRFKDVHTIGFASLNFCRADRGERNRTDREAVEGVELAELVYWQPTGKGWLKDVSFRYQAGINLSNGHLWRLSYRHYSFLDWLQVLSNPRNWWHAFKKRRRGQPPYFRGSRPSTGMMAVQYALERYPSAECIHVCGIGVTWSGGHFYDNKHLHDNFHEAADTKLYRSLVSNNCRVVFCEVENA